MKSFSSQILRPLFLTLLLVTLTLTGGSIIYLQTKLSPQITNLAQEVLMGKSHEIDAWLARHLATLEQLSHVVSEESFNAENQKPLLDLLERNLRHPDLYDSVGFITLDGDKFLTSGAAFSVINRDYFKRLKKEAQIN